MKYRPEVDGLRTVAVLPVIFFHAGFGLFSGGFVGVDIFFVISGFLITTILINELDDNKFSIARFYERRARRILPALFLVIAVCVPFAWLYLAPGDMVAFAKSVIAVATFSSNFLFWQESGYFATESELLPLLHTWSLAVEEQYYILFPLYLAFVWRWGKKFVAISLGVILVVSLALSHWAAFNEPNANFYLLPTRAWELMIGSLGAVWLQDPRRLARVPMAWREGLSLVGLGLLVYSIFVFTSETPFPSLYALVPTVGSILVILFAGQLPHEEHKTLVKRLLGSAPFVGIGLISYSAYLWHQPAFAFARHAMTEPVTPDQYWLLIGVSLLLAYLTWRFVEAPFRDKTRVTVPGLVKTFVPIFAVAIVASVAMNVFSQQYKDYWLGTKSATYQTTFNLMDRPGGNDNFGVVDGRQDNGACRFNVRGLWPDIEHRLEECATQYGPGQLVLGDSHAIDLYGVVASRFPDEPFIVGITRGGCQPHDMDDECHYEAVAQFMEAHPDAIGHVIYEQAGFELMQPGGRKHASRHMFSYVALADTVPDFAIDEGKIDTVNHYLDRLAKVSDVTWLGPRLSPHINKNTILGYGCDYPFTLRSGQEDRFITLDERMAELVPAAGIRYQSQLDIMEFEFPVDMMSCEENYWSDGDHFSAVGEVRFGERLPADFLYPEDGPES